MKICLKCGIYYQEQIMSCRKCGEKLREVSLQEALKITQQAAFKTRISGKKELPDAYKQYHIRSYLGNRSLFLDYDLHKNRLKHGRGLKRFFIAPVNITSVLNLPWLLFNVITTNLFHMQYTEYCSRCQCKTIKGCHTPEECDYNIEYFIILDDILNGRIVDHKHIYEQYAREKRAHGIHSAYDDLFLRKVRWEAFWDILSIGLSVMFWLYIAVNVSFPMFKVLAQKLQQIEAYEVGLSLR